MQHIVIHGCLYFVLSSVMPLVGGIRQQLVRDRQVAGLAAEDHDDQPPQSKVKTHRYVGRSTEVKSIGKFLKHMYLTGRISGPELQEGSAASVHSQASDAITDKMAKVGSSGNFRGNAHRDIMRSLNKSTDRPSVYQTNICFWNTRTDSQVWEPCDFSLPHEILDYEIGKTHIDDWVGIRDNVHLQSTFENWCADVGVNSSDPDLVALGLWGDSAVIGPSESLFVLLVNCLSGIYRKRFWVCAFGKKVVCQCGCHGRHTFDSIFKVISWSLGALLAGEFPSIRDDGIPFSQSNKIGDQARHKARGKRKKLRLRGGCIQKRGHYNYNLWESINFHWSGYA